MPYLDEVDGLGPLDFIYAPSTDVAADARWFAEVLGAELVFAIDSGGTKVAMIRLGTGEPPLLLTDHLPDETLQSGGILR